jgi:hypothetical protein
MPDYPQSTAPPVAVVPPVLTPDQWEDQPCFRETFLLHFSKPEYNAALRGVSVALFDVTLSSHLDTLQPDQPGPYVRHELAAAAADLRHLQGFLGMVSESEEGLDEYDEQDRPARRLVRLAARAAVRIGKIAAALEEAVRP